MITKIVFIDEVPLAQRLYERYGIQILLDAGFTVEIWDCIPFLVPSLIGSFVPDPLQFKGIRSLRTRREAIEAIRCETKATVFVIDIGYRFQSWAIYRELSRKNHIYGVQLFDAQPGFINEPISKFVGWLHRITQSPIHFFYAGFQRLSPRLLGIRPPDFILFGGDASVTNRYRLGQPTHWVRAHGLDYDSFLRENREPNQDLDIPNHNYSVFLDEFWPFHPDWKFENLPPPVSPNNYYPKLVKFFERVEKELGLPVIIAAHPKSHYESLPDYFKGRKVIRNKTVRLVKHANLVMTHDSLSMNYAILYRKPVVFLDCSKEPIHKRMGYIRVDIFAKTIGKQPINLDEPYPTVDWEAERQVNDKAYAAYQEKYIKQRGSPEKPAWQIFIDFLKTLE